VCWRRRWIHHCHSRLPFAAATPESDPNARRSSSRSLALINSPVIPPAARHEWVGTPTLPTIHHTHKQSLPARLHPATGNRRNARYEHQPENGRTLHRSHFDVVCSIWGRPAGDHESDMFPRIIFQVWAFEDLQPDDLSICIWLRGDFCGSSPSSGRPNAPPPLCRR